MKENQKKEQSGNDRDTYRSGPADNLGEWFQDVVQDAVDSMDFTGLAQNIRDTVDSIREGASVPGTRGPSGDGRPKAGARPQPGRGPRERGRAQRDSRVQTPVSGRQPGKKGWIRRVLVAAKHKVAILTEADSPITGRGVKIAMGLQTEQVGDICIDAIRVIPTSITRTSIVVF